MCKLNGKRHGAKANIYPSYPQFYLPSAAEHNCQGNRLLSGSCGSVLVHALDFPSSFLACICYSTTCYSTTAPYPSPVPGQSCFPDVSLINSNVCTIIPWQVGLILHQNILFNLLYTFLEIPSHEPIYFLKTKNQEIWIVISLACIF